MTRPLVSRDGVREFMVRKGDSVYVFPTLKQMYDYINENPLHEPPRLVPIKRTLTRDMYYINVVPKSAQYRMTQWVYVYLDTPYMHPTYGAVNAWGFWDYTYMS